MGSANARAIAEFWRHHYGSRPCASVRGIDLQAWAMF